VVHKTFFGPYQIKLVPDATNIIVSRHTIEHVPDVHSFVSALATPMTTKERTLFIETPDANWILENTAFQDFFYEHCSIYTPASVARILGEYGLNAKTTPVYGGQYMWTKAKLSQNKDLSDTAIEQDTALAYIEKSTAMLDQWNTFIRQRSQQRPVAIWGAASKGVTFALLQPETDNSNAGIACAIDLNKAKQNCFLPISGIPVVSPQTAHEMGIGTVIIMNPNYKAEIETMAANMGWSPDFVTLND
jgi:hypothetical protein